MTDPGFLVRPTRPDDLDAIADVYRSMAAHHAALEPDRYRVPDVELVRARFAPELADPTNLHLVAEVAGRVVASLDAVIEPVPGPGNLRQRATGARIGIAVLDAHRGMGIGTALMAEAEAWARSHSLDQLTLDVAASNVGAIRLYERLGFETITLGMAKPLR